MVQCLTLAFRVRVNALVLLERVISDRYQVNSGALHFWCKHHSNKLCSIPLNMVKCFLLLFFTSIIKVFDTRCRAFLNSLRPSSYYYSVLLATFYSWKKRLLSKIHLQNKTTVILTISEHWVSLNYCRK